MASRMYRHGDILLVETSTRPATLPERSTRVVLAEGEVTGHAHILTAPKILIWDTEGQRHVELTEDGTLTHEEHGQIDIRAGVYEVIRQREYQPERTRWVAD